MREAIERQTATSDILKVIAASPTDVQPVLDAIARMAFCEIPESVACRSPAGRDQGTGEIFAALREQDHPEDHPEHIGHAGSANDRVDVRLWGNPGRLTPTQFAQRLFRDSPMSPVTFAGRSAVEVRTTQFEPFDALTDRARGC